MARLTGACFLGRLTHVNVNYRYKPEEVRYIVDNSDATVVVYAREFRDAVAQIHNQLDKVKVFVEVGPPDVADFRHAVRKARHHRQRRQARHRTRSPDDQVIVYTGGTTGMPKGVMYAQGDLTATLLARIFIATGKLPEHMSEIVAFVKAAGDMNARYLPACPQMHGTGFFGTMSTLLMGGCVVTVDNTHRRRRRDLDGGRRRTASPTWRSSAIRSASRCCACSTKIPANTTSRASSPSARPARCGARRSSTACSNICRRRC